MIYPPTGFVKGRPKKILIGAHSLENTGVFEGKMQIYRVNFYIQIITFEKLLIIYIKTAIMIIIKY